MKKKFNFKGKSLIVLVNKLLIFGYNNNNSCK